MATTPAASTNKEDPYSCRRCRRRREAAAFSASCGRGCRGRPIRQPYRRRHCPPRPNDVKLWWGLGGDVPIPILQVAALAGKPPPLPPQRSPRPGSLLHHKEGKIIAAALTDDALLSLHDDGGVAGGRGAANGRGAGLERAGARGRDAPLHGGGHRNRRWLELLVRRPRRKSSGRRSDGTGRHQGSASASSYPHSSERRFGRSDHRRPLRAGDPTPPGQKLNNATFPSQASRLPADRPRPCASGRSAAAASATPHPLRQRPGAKGNSNCRRTPGASATCHRESKKPAMFLSAASKQRAAASTGAPLPARAKLRAVCYASNLPAAAPSASGGVTR
eukprot:364972-Chlamydomonas_euryale.AAC.5